MNIIRLLFVTLSSICLSECYLWFDCGDINYNDPIHVVYPEFEYDIEHLDAMHIRPYIEDLVNKFRNKCQPFYNFHFISMTGNAARYAKGIYNERYFIDLFARDYNEKTINSESIINAGEISMMIEDWPCKRRRHKYDAFFIRKEICDLMNPGTYTPVKRSIKGTKLISKAASELQSGILLDFLKNLNFVDNILQSQEYCSTFTEKVRDLKTVLICSDDYCTSNPLSETLRFARVPANKCKESIDVHRNNLLAVLAPAPFEMDYEFPVPTVFYTTPYMNPEYFTRFPNSLNLVQGSLLPYAFVKFIKDSGWRRVAVLSDDAPYSEEFENKLLELFHKERIIYGVQRCYRKKCNFDEAVKNLRDTQSRIVIANVEEHNAQLLQQSIAVWDRFAWLFRVWPFGNQPSKSVSITMTSANLEDYGSCTPNQSTNAKSWANCIAVLNGLRAIANAKHNFHSYNTSRKQFYRLFKEATEEYVKPSYTVYVTQNPDVIAKVRTMNIDPTGAITDVMNYESLHIKNAQDEKRCIAKTNNFAKPCDETIILLFMFVILAFCITLLITVCYFDKTSPVLSRRYQQL